MYDEASKLDSSGFVDTNPALPSTFSADTRGFAEGSPLFTHNGSLDVEKDVVDLTDYVNRVSGKNTYNTKIASNYIKIIQSSLKMFLNTIGSKPACLPVDFDAGDIYSSFGVLAKYVKLDIPTMFVDQSAYE